MWDVSTKERMDVVIQYVNNYEQAIECILGIVYVTNTTSLSLQVAVEDLFFKNTWAFLNCMVKDMMVI